MPSPGSTVYSSRISVEPFPCTYVALRSVAPVSSSITGAAPPDRSTRSSKTTITAIVLLTPYASSVFGEYTRTTDGPDVSISMFEVWPSACREFGAGRSRFALFPASSRIVPDERDRAPAPV